eukprot:Clim_evm44s229 gene=Clim_evmTU44s229
MAKKKNVVGQETRQSMGAASDKLDPMYMQHKGDDYPDPPGIKEKRGCTDVAFFLLLIGFWVGVFYVSSVGFKEGNPERLLKGLDSFGNICNAENTLSETYIADNSAAAVNGVLNLVGRDVVLFYDYTTTEGMEICASSCPDTTTDSYTAEQAKNWQICDYDFDYDSAIADAALLTAAIASGKCPSQVYESTAVLNRCSPVDPDVIGDAFADIFSSGEADKIFSDVANSWKVILVTCVIAIFIALLIILSLRFFAGIMVWGSTLIFLVGMGAATYVFNDQYKKADNEITDLENAGQPVDDNLKDNRLTFQILFYIFIVLTVIFFILIVALRNRIRLCVQIFKESAKCVAHMPTMLFLPFIAAIVVIGFAAFFVAGMLYLSTADEVEYLTTSTPSGFAQFNTPQDIAFMQWYAFFGFLWMSQFVVACNQMTIAGAVGEWYWTFHKSNMSRVPVWRSFTRLIRYHLGTAALGSLIIAIIQLLRALVNVAKRRAQTEGNKVAEYIAKCCACCLWCLEKFMKFVNRNAYVMTAVKGYNFCGAAKRAFELLLRNVLRVAVINSVGDFVLFLCKVATTVFSVLICLAFIENDILLEDPSDMNYEAVPAILVGIFAFFIAHVFLSVFEMCIDTILLSFCEDSEVNDGSQEKPYFMSDSLLKYVKNSSKALSKKQRKKLMEKQAAELPNTPMVQA